MDIEAVKRKIKAEMDFHKPGSSARYSLDEALEVLEGMEEVDDPPVDVDDGFVILPMPRYEALREAEEALEETRFEPANGEPDEKQATIDALTRRVDRLCVAKERLIQALDGRGQYIHEQAEEIGRLREAAKARADATPWASAARVKDEVFLKHIQDLQAEVDGIKDRLDELVNNLGAANLRYGHIKNRLDETMPSVDAKLGALGDGIKDRLDAQDKAVGETLSTIFDRLGGMTARLNKLDADVMPFRRIGPGTDPEARERDEATRDRLLREIKRVADGVGSTKP